MEAAVGQHQLLRLLRRDHGVREVLHRPVAESQECEADARYGHGREREAAPARQLRRGVRVYGLSDGGGGDVGRAAARELRREYPSRPVPIYGERHLACTDVRKRRGVAAVHKYGRAEGTRCQSERDVASTCALTRARRTEAVRERWAEVTGFEEGMSARIVVTAAGLVLRCIFFILRPRIASARTPIIFVASLSLMYSVGFTYSSLVARGPEARRA